MLVTFTIFGTTCVRNELCALVGWLALFHTFGSEIINMLIYIYIYPPDLGSESGFCVYERRQDGFGGSLNGARGSTKGVEESRVLTR